MIKKDNKINNEVVKYHNNLNTLSMRRWTAEEMNFFFAVIAKVRDRGTKLIIFDSDELKELSGFANEHVERWLNVMNGVADKALNLTYSERSTDGLIFKKMNLFSFFEINGNARTVEVEVSSKFEYVVNRLEVQFTQYELAEFTDIRSTYAKTMYRLLKQWRTVGNKEYKIDEFRELLEIPKSYTNGEVTRRVLEPIKRELECYFSNFNYRTLKSKKRGNPVLGYEFIWRAEKTGKFIPNKYVTGKNPSNKVLSNVPEWHNENYQNKTTETQKAEMKKRTEKLLAELNDL